jgi:hypothetical protein
VRIIYAWSSATADRRRETGRSGAKTTTATKDRTPRRRRPGDRVVADRHQCCVTSVTLTSGHGHHTLGRPVFRGEEAPRRRDASHLSAWDPPVIRHWVTCLRDPSPRSPCGSRLRSEMQAGEVFYSIFFNRITRAAVGKFRFRWLASVAMICRRTLRFSPSRPWHDVTTSRLRPLALLAHDFPPRLRVLSNLACNT